MMLDSIDPEFEVLTAPETTEQELMRFMTDWNRLSENRDTSALDRMLPADLIITASDGRVLDKQQFLDTIANMPDDFHLTEHEQTVQIFDHTAIVRAGYELEIAGKFDSYVRTDLDEVFLRTLRCSNCGMTTHWEPLTEPPHERMGVNANMFDPAALAGLPVVQVDGASW